MSLLEYNEVKPRKFVVMNGEPYECLTSHVFRKQMRKPVNATKLKNLITGKVMEYSFHQSEKTEEAELPKKTMKFLYTNKGEFWFCEEKDPSKRSALSPEIIGDNTKFLKPNSFVDILTFDDQVIGVQMPIKVELLVKEAAAAVKGNTAQGGTKQVTLETGAVINTPMFINEGDVIVINTETGEYVERKGGKF